MQRFAYGSVNNFRITNTDPHPGNYLFEEDGTVTFLDFGCVAHVPPHMASAMQALTRAGIGDDVEGLWRAAVAAGIWTEDDPVAPAEAHAYWRLGLERYWGEQPFTVTPESAATLNERQWMPGNNAFRHMRAPRDWTMIGRMDSTMTAVLAGLRATGDWRAMAFESMDGAPPRTPMGELHVAWLADHPTAIVAHA